MTKQCPVFERQMGMCDVPRPQQEFPKTDALIMLILFVIGISWLLRKAIETPDDIPPPEPKWPFGE